MSAKLAAGPVVPWESATEFGARRRITVPSVGLGTDLATVTVYGPAPEPVTFETVKPEAVPCSEKSPLARPLTDWLKVTW